MNHEQAAHHEAAHAVVGVVLGMPLQDSGIHIDTVDGGVTFNLCRLPGDLANTPEDIEERERTIVMTKTGYAANLKLDPCCLPCVAADDRARETRLLDEMYRRDDERWMETDNRLAATAQGFVNQHWETIRDLAQRLLRKPVTRRSNDSFSHWNSPYPDEKWMDGDEVSRVLILYGLNAIVRKESDGKYLSPEVHDRPQGL